MRILHRKVEKIVTLHPKAKRTTCQPRPPPSVSRREWQFESIRCGIRQPLDAICREVVILSLLSISDNRRACGLKLFDRLPDGFVVKRFHTRVRAAVPIDCIKQFQRARNTPDRLGRNSHGSVYRILRPSFPAVKEHLNDAPSLGCAGLRSRPWSWCWCWLRVSKVMFSRVKVRFPAKTAGKSEDFTRE